MNEHEYFTDRLGLAEAIAGQTRAGATSSAGTIRATNQRVLHQLEQTTDGLRKPADMPGSGRFNTVVADYSDQLRRALGYHSAEAPVFGSLAKDATLELGREQLQTVMLSQAARMTQEASVEQLIKAWNPDDVEAMARDTDAWSRAYDTWDEASRVIDSDQPWERIYERDLPWRQAVESTMTPDQRAEADLRRMGARTAAVETFGVPRASVAGVEAQGATREVSAEDVARSITPMYGGPDVDGPGL